MLLFILNSMRAATKPMFTGTFKGEQRQGTPGAQILVLDSSQAAWRVDASFDDLLPGGRRRHLAISVLTEATFGTDGQGRPQAYEELRQRLPVPVAGGESMPVSALTGVISGRMMDIVQPDLVMHGGFQPMLNLWALSDAFGVKLIPHCFDGQLVRVIYPLKIAVTRNPGRKADQPLRTIDMHEGFPW